MSAQGLGGTLVQFFRFGLVGGSGFVVNLAVTYLLTQFNGGVAHDNRVLIEVPGPWALRFTVLVWILAFMIANVWNFQLNRIWTFKRASDQMRGWWTEFWPFFAIGALAAAAGVVIKIALTNPTSPLYLPDPPFNDIEGLRARAYWAQLFTIVLTMPINYLLNRIWTFRAIAPAEAQAIETARTPEDARAD